MTKRSWILGVLCVGGVFWFSPALQGCQSCNLRGCPAEIVYSVLDANSTLVSDFDVTAIIDGHSLTLRCPIPQESESAAANIGGQWVHLDCLAAGTFGLYQVADRTLPIALTVTSATSGTYQGTPEPELVTDETFNGDEGCGECTTGTATITLQ